MLARIARKSTVNTAKVSLRAFGGHHAVKELPPPELMKYTVADGKIRLGIYDADITEAHMKLPSHKADHKYVITKDYHGNLEVDGETILPGLADTLEWCLDTPPNVHQFEEPPIVVEIEHLHNLIPGEH